MSADGTFKLSDIKLDGGDCSRDMVQVLESTKASVSATYVYVSAAQALEFGDASYEGWYNFTMDTAMDDVSFDLGQAFLGNFNTKAVKPTYAGQVESGSTEIDCTGKQYVMFGNPVPKTIKLGTIDLSGGDCSRDMVQVLESTKASVSDTYVYVSAAQALEFGDASYQGWYNFTMDESKDDVDVKVGDAFLANFNTKTVTITFPAAM